MMSKALSRIYVGLVYLFLYAPIAVLIIFSFNSSKSRNVWTGFTFDWYLKLFNNETIISSLFNTLLVAAVSSVVATVIGTAAAVGIHAMNKNLRAAVVNVTYLPVINPEIVTGVSLMLLFVFVGVKLGFTTLIIAHITFNVPYVILNVIPKLRQMDSHLYEAAQDLGCDPAKAFFRVVIPEIMPGIITGFLMAFTYSIDDFVISYFTSGPSSQTLPITIFSMTRKKVSPEINALSAIIFVIVLVILILMNIKDSNIYRKRIKKEAERI
ncbi:ABC transporter permease [Acetanaerobacterium elongatum]|nr:ABC transporter permease [Acetanaerobacterium elongatum]